MQIEATGKLMYDHGFRDTNLSRLDSQLWLKSWLITDGF